MAGLSFEFFPPKTEAAEANLWSAVERLAPLKLDFVSVTYGAGGSTRDRTHACLRKLIEETSLMPAAHLTCVAASKDDVDSVIDAYQAAGIRHIGSVELVEAIAARGGFEISVSAYPEKHPESKSIEHDIDLLKAKIDAGASRAITQFAFDTQVFLRYRDALLKANIDIPILPGIMPTTNFKGARRMASLCGASVPDSLIAKYDGLEDDLAARKIVAAEVAAEQCKTLLDEGFNDIHFYTLNQADLAFDVCTELGLGAKR